MISSLIFGGGLTSAAGSPVGGDGGVGLVLGLAGGGRGLSCAAGSSRSSLFASLVLWSDIVAGGWARAINEGLENSPSDLSSC